MAQTMETVEQDQATRNESKKQAQAVEFTEVQNTEIERPAGSIDILLDMEIPVTVAIGQTELSVRRLLQLGPGAVLTLDKSIDEPVELYLKNSRFATGSVVVVDNQFAVRIKEIFGAQESAEDTSQTETR